MTGEPAWRRYLSFWRPQVARDVNHELAFHFEQRIEELIAAGSTPDAARRLASEEFGDVPSVRSALIAIGERRAKLEGRRETLARFAQDLRFAWRSARRSPAFALVVVATLGLAIAATTATFSLVYGVLFRPLPFRDPERVFSIVTERAGTGDVFATIPGLAYAALRQARTLEAVAEYSPTSSSVVMRPDQAVAVELRTKAVSVSMFRVLGALPFIGRVFTRDEAARDDAVAVLIYDTWQREFAGDPRVIGRSLDLDGKRVTILGVLPKDFWMPGFSSESSPDLLVPSGDVSVPKPTDRFAVLARVRAGVPVSVARAEVAALTGPTLLEGGERTAGTIVTLRPVRDLVAANLQVTLLALLGAVSFVLALACVNVGNMTLARGRSRRRELAVRTALGAKRSRLVAQLITESIVLALAGGVVGLALTRVILSVGAGRLPLSFQRLPGIVLDWRVGGVAIATSFLCGLLFAVIPAIRLTRADLTASLTGAVAIPRRRRSRWGRGIGSGGLVAVEVALALILLAGAALLGKTIIKLQRIELGYDTSSLATVRARLPRPRYANAGAALHFFIALRERVAAIPGVSAVASVDLPPLGTSIAANPVQIDGGERTVVDVRRVSAGYFALLRMRLSRGHLFADQGGGPLTAVINEALARRLTDRDAIGRTIAVERGPTIRVVGVVSNVREAGVTQPVAPTLYLSIDDPDYRRVGSQTLLVQSMLSRAALLRQTGQLVAEIDNAVPLTVTELDETRWRPFAASRFYTWTLGAFAVFATILAAIGLAGVIAEEVSNRTREIGIRVALGARPGQVVGAMIAPQLGGAAVGFVLGAIGAWNATRVLESLLYAVAPTDTPTLVGAAVTLALVAIMASVIPARRAAGVDPARVLRE
jgi:putative ABC transport system permease protein